MNRVRDCVPAYNATEFFADAFGGILVLTRPADEFLIIDDGPRDDACEISSRNPGVRLARRERNHSLDAEQRISPEVDSCGF
jgi:hypothetical protein